MTISKKTILPFSECRKHARVSSETLVQRMHECRPRHSCNACTSVVRDTSATHARVSSETLVQRMHECRPRHSCNACMHECRTRHSCNACTSVVPTTRACEHVWNHKRKYKIKKRTANDKSKGQTKTSSTDPGVGTPRIIV